MNFTRRLTLPVIALALIGAFGAPTGAAATTRDSLYIGDGTDNTIKSFDANTGDARDVLNPPAGVTGPRGILHLANGDFLVAYQNPGADYPGEIDRFNRSGVFLRALVPSEVAGTPNPDAPFAPRGMILGPDHRTLYVADFGRADIGAVKRYDVGTGKFLGDLDFSSFTDDPVANNEFHPRGLVFGPDGRLYVSLFSELDFEHFGWILTYDLRSRAVRVFASYNAHASASNCHLYLHRPEGLAFGPDRRLYFIGQQPSLSSPTDTDKILVFRIGRHGTGLCRPWVDLDQPGQAHTYAQALVFGPRGHLIVPTRVYTTPEFSVTGFGAVRSYNVTDNPAKYTVLVPPITDAGGTCLNTGCGWWYLTSAHTNPVTLAYQPK